MTKWFATSLVVVAALTALAAQSLDPISAEDILNVRTATVLDLSDDGRRVAIGVRRLADNATTDHRAMARASASVHVPHDRRR
jgi:hypothetical protein